MYWQAVHDPASGLQARGFVSLKERLCVAVSDVLSIAGWLDG